MKLKTEFNCFNFEDFVQKEGQLHELTVTITLYEYRNLISEAVRSEEIINRLQEEKNRLTKQNEALKKLVIKYNPDFIRSVNETIRALFDDDAEEESEVEDG